MAVLSETVDTIEAGDSGVIHDLDENPRASQTSTSPLAPVLMKEGKPKKDTNRNILRQQLRAAVDIVLWNEILYA